MPSIRVGTCSWKFESWAGLVYSAPKGINHLEEYARKYDTVEIDQWFWSLFKSNDPVLPDPRVVQEYVDSVPADFRFTVKVPNALTLTHHHHKDRKAPLEPNPNFLSPALFEEFLGILRPMHGRLGPLMFQFEYLNKRKMPGQVEFLSRLEEFLDGVDRSLPLAIEIRNRNYLDDRYFDFLLEQDLGHVLLQGYWMPSIVEILEKHRTFFEKQSVQVVRLHGGDRGEMEKRTGKKWNRIVEPRADEIDEILERIRGILGEDADLYLNINNHYEGSAPLTIETIRSILAAN